MLEKFIKSLGNFSAIEKIRNKFTGLLITTFVALFLIGVLVVFNFVPNDEVQGFSAKIMYIHVPSAWACSLIYLLMTISSLAFLIYKNQFCVLLAYSLSLSGIFFNILCIVTGMIWGKQTWGVYWVWDPRLTSVLILLLLYIFYIAVFNSDNQSNSSFKIASITNLIGAINLPIIKFSVEMWNSLHQPASIIRNNGIAIAPIMFYPLLIFFLAFAAFTLSIIIINLHNLLLEKKINHLEINKTIC